MANLKWRLLVDSITDPALNLAIEEAILRCRKDDRCQDTLRIWQNDKSVILGCHTDIRDEVNLQACRRLGIKILRRTSGGGAVYQDLGNINYSVIIKEVPMSSAYDVPAVYKVFSEVVLTGLRILNIQAVFNPPNLILLNGKKISGLAQHRFYDTILFHGTLLVNLDLNTLSKTLLNPKHLVTNISSELSVNLTIEKIAEALATAFQESLKIQFVYDNLSPSEEILSNELLRAKYSRDHWNL